MARGRRTTLRPIVFDAIVNAVRAGASIPVAAGQAGVPQRSVYEWYERGRGDSDRPPTPFTVQFAQALQQAEAEAAMNKIAVIEKIANGGWLKTRQRITTYPDGRTETMTEEEEAAPVWQAAAWWLERTRPAEFGRPWRPREESVVITDSNVLVITPEQAVIAFRRAQAEAQAALPEPTPEPALEPRRNGSHS